MNLKELHVKIFGNKENVIHDNVNRENGWHDDHDMLNITGLHTKFRTSSVYKNVTENDELFKEDFVSYIKEHFAIILIGDDIFKKDIVRQIFSSIPQKVKVFNDVSSLVSKNISSLKKISKRKPLIGNKFIVYIEYEVLSRSARKELLSILREGLDHVFLIISVPTQLRKDIYKNINVKSLKIKLIDLSYPSKRFLMNYISKKLNCEITYMALLEFIKRLGANYESYNICINMLNSYCSSNNVSIITPKIIRAIVNDESSYKIDDIFRCITLLDRKTVHITALYDLLQDMEPNQIFAILRRYALYLLEAKIAIDKGLISNDGNIKIDIALNNEELVRISEDLLKLRDIERIKYFLTIAEALTFKECLMIYLVFHKFKYVYTDQLYKIIFSLYNREFDIIFKGIKYDFV